VVSTVNEVTDGPGSVLTPRFGFGRNWSRFLRVLNEPRVEEAEGSLARMLLADRLTGRTFLDIGSGSGLSSLAAFRLGAARVHSFDYDSESVACTAEVRRRFASNARTWTVERGDVLDPGYLATLGTWDVVYSWGVLHHTGDLWAAVTGAASCVGTEGTLLLALYNDQGAMSRFWTAVKRTYQRGAAARAVILATFIPIFAIRGFVGDLVRGERVWKRYTAGARGMSAAHDWIDWLGGYPFQVAKPEEVVQHCDALGFRLRRMRTVGGRLGNNEFTFQRVDPPAI
jgi:2-polyprenyl-6-hydroxyphenyl methylase/3-demethylubiquinone-9 3-methyltransferase